MPAAPITKPKFEVGDDLFIRDPQRFEPGCVSITGKVTAVTSRDGAPSYIMAAYICFPYPRKGIDQPTHVAERDVGLRIGAPISQLSGRPGHPGYDQFKAVAASWGYD